MKKHKDCACPRCRKVGRIRVWSQYHFAVAGGNYCGITCGYCSYTLRVYKDLDKEALYKRWNSLSCITGKQVVIKSNEQTIEGEALKIGIDGSLIIKTSDNQEQKVR